MDKFERDSALRGYWIKADEEWLALQKASYSALLFESQDVFISDRLLKSLNDYHKLLNKVSRL